MDLQKLVSNFSIDNQTLQFNFFCLEMKTMHQKYHFKVFNQVNLRWFHECHISVDLAPSQGPRRGRGRGGQSPPLHFCANKNDNK